MCSHQPLLEPSYFDTQKVTLSSINQPKWWIGLLTGTYNTARHNIKSKIVGVAKITCFGAHKRLLRSFNACLQALLSEVLPKTSTILKTRTDWDWDTVILVTVIYVWRVLKIFKTWQRKWVEITCLTKQVNMFVWRGLSERNLEIWARWLHLPWQPLEKNTCILRSRHTLSCSYNTQSINISFFLWGIYSIPQQHCAIMCVACSEGITQASFKHLFNHQEKKLTQ